MNRSKSLFSIVFIFLFFLFISVVGFQEAHSAVSAPVLKWRQDCSNWQCTNAWYSPPAAADLDGDGHMEVVYAGERLYILDGENGAQEFRSSSLGRVWPGVIVADVDGDQDLEIVTGDNSSKLRVWDHQGGIVWEKELFTREIRSLAAYDLDGDRTLELAAGRAGSGKPNTWILEHDGGARSGWPQLSDDSGYAAGIYNDNIAVGDIDGDDRGEIVVPSDVHYICAYNDDGSHIQAHSMYGDKKWGKVGVWESLVTEIKGWGECSGDRRESYRTNFALGPAAIADVNGDGVMEIVVVGNVYDCSLGDPEGSAYYGVYIFNADRGRFKSGAYDWETPPVDTGALLTLDYSVIENPTPNPVTADLDGDGEMEIIYSSYDGRVHAFWLDKTEHGNWPFAVYQASEGFYRFAAEPVAADLDNDGRTEVIIVTWPQKGTNKTGKIHILDYQGNQLHALDLPGVPSGRDYNGALAAPTLADIDSDSDLELIVSTRYTGAAVYDLPGTSNARVLWSTGRGNFLRNGLAQAAGPRTPAAYDFNQDGRVDILYRRPSTGNMGVWFMNGTTETSWSLIRTPDGDPANHGPDWDIRGVGDFNDDGYNDILYRHSGGNVGVWLMNGVNETTWRAFTDHNGQRPANHGPDWDIEGSADFNGDGRVDVLYRHPSTGNMGVWFMNGATETSWSLIRTPDGDPANHGPAWDIEGVGDFNDDGYNDILYRHSGGNVGVWLMNGVNETTWRAFTDHNGQRPANHGPWNIKGAADYDGDGRVDVLYRHPDTGNIGVWLMNGATETDWNYIDNHGDWDIR